MATGVHGLGTERTDRTSSGNDLPAPSGELTSHCGRHSNLHRVGSGLGREIEQELRIGSHHLVIGDCEEVQPHQIAGLLPQQGNGAQFELGLHRQLEGALVISLIRLGRDG